MVTSKSQSESFLDQPPGSVGLDDDLEAELLELLLGVLGHPVPHRAVGHRHQLDRCSRPA